MGSNFTRELPDEAATIEAGRQFAKQLKLGLTIYLHGDLGAGKTTFVRGVLQGLGYKGKVKSPTYTLVEPYEVESNAKSRYNLYHFDLYRFNDVEEWEAAGFREYFNENTICFVEWPEKAGDLLPEPDFDIKIAHLTSGRKVEITAH
jgi:tRNA threonylcarbamoyladenosine biosynthesis protein TsaE